MKECVRGHLSEAVSAYEDRPREQWILDFPAQVALTGSQIWWSNDMELVFKRLEEGFESALKDYNKKQVHYFKILKLNAISWKEKLTKKFKPLIIGIEFQKPIIEVASAPQITCLHIVHWKKVLIQH